MLGGFAERYGLGAAMAARLGCAFGGGIAGTAETCGAVSGALMVLGLDHGAIAADDKASKERTYAATREFLRRFRERHGSTVCRELLGVNIATPDGRATALRDGLFRSRCPLFVRDAAELAADLAR